MPKIPGKKCARKKPLESNNSSNKPDAKKKGNSTIKTNDEDSIAVSKQLSQRIQSSGSSRIRTTRSSNINNEPKICGNGKPMPSLADLEKMFEDSDGESPEEIKTPNEIPLSPKSIKNIASRLMDKITKISDPTELLDVLPPPPIVPQKKPKKSGIPYIIGCKERPQVIKKPNTSFCKGDDYGIDLNADSSDDDSCPKKRQKRSKKANISKSIFNAKSDEIAEKLKENDDSDGSTDSNKTDANTYYHNPELSGRPQSFSPIPSTSRDNETFLKNDQSFNESFIGGNGNNGSLNDVEIIDNSCETIVIDDDLFIPSTKKYSDNDAVEIIEPLDKDAFKPMPPKEPDNDDSVQIVEPDEIEKTNRNNNKSPIDVDDYYSSIDINQRFDDHDVGEIKIDELIQENNAIIDKFANKNELNVITNIEPSSDNQNKTKEQANTESAIETIDDSAIIPETFKNAITPPITDIRENLNRHSEPNNGPSETHNSPSKAHKGLINEHNTTNLRKKNTLAKKRENMMETIIRNFFHNEESQSIPLTKETHVSETVDLTNDTVISTRQVQGCYALSEKDMDSLIHLASSLEYDHGFNSIIVNLHNLSQQKQPSTEPDRSKFIPGTYIFQRRIKPAQRRQIAKPSPQPVLPLTPIEDTPKSSRCFGDCPICMESLGNNSVASTVCGHVFCLKCIQAAIKSNGKKCPTCRKHLKGVGYHQLFL